MKRLLSNFFRNYKVSIPTMVALVAVVAWLAFGYFAIQTAFVDDKVNEALPSFDTTTTAVADTVARTTVVATTVPAAATPTVATTPPTAPPPQIITEAAGEFVSRDHPTSGNATILGNGSDQRFLRFENFKTDNGPDLNVYLVNSAVGMSDFVDLGDLKGNIGDQNYEVPAAVDISVYDTVVIWCVRFSSPFGEATLSAPV